MRKQLVFRKLSQVWAEKRKTTQPQMEAHASMAVAFIRSFHNERFHHEKPDGDKEGTTFGLN